MKLTKAYIGSIEIKRTYLGSALIFDNTLNAPVLESVVITDNGDDTGSMTLTFAASEVDGTAVVVSGSIDAPADADPVDGDAVAAGIAGGASAEFEVETVVGATSVSVPITGEISGSFDVFVAARYAAVTTMSNVVSALGVEFDTTSAAGTTFTEDWSAYAAGNTFTELEAAYTRPSNAFVATIVTDANAPAGLACDYGVSANNHYWAFRDDVAAALTAGGWTTVEVLLLMELQTTSNLRGGFGYSSAGGALTGMFCPRYGDTNHQIGIGLNGDPNGGGGGLTLATGSDGQLWWVRLQVEGQFLRGRAWQNGGAEGVTWAEMDNVSAVDFLHVGMVGRIGTLGRSALYYSVGIDAAAPAPA